MHKVMSGVGGRGGLGGQTPAPTDSGLAALALPETLITAGDIPPARRDAMLASARRFYQFWNTGDEDLLRQAISDGFVDHTLQPGRPQGPAGTAGGRARGPRCRPRPPTRRRAAEPGRGPGWGSAR